MKFKKNLNEKLYPKIKQMKAEEESYRSEIEAISQIKMLDNLLEEWTSKIQRLTEEGMPEKNVKYKPKDEFGEEFYKDTGEILDSFLKIGNYPKYNVTTFDKSSFDIMINGKKKAVSHGKGFRLYLNSITVMALSEYINKSEVYKPEFLIIDTPLEGLSEKNIDQPSESMKSGIFDLFLKRGERYQTIVVENPDHLPNDIDFEDENINVISYENEEGFLKEA